MLEQFRSLLTQYPKQNRWSKEDGDFHPINREIVDAITKPLTSEDIELDDGWLEDSTVLVTSNVDRAVLNACMAKMLAAKNNHLLFRWRKALVTHVPESVTELIYNEDEHPNLFGYFFSGAPGQILDDANGNVGLGVANGTRCWFHSIGWDNKNLTAEALKLAEEALEQGQLVVNLPFPPQFINVRLADRDGKPLAETDWPPGLNLNSPGLAGYEGSGEGDVIIPVGYVISNKDNYSISLTDSGGSSQAITYSKHAVDLAMVLTVWKAQGGTFGHVILLLEGSQHAPSWQFEHLYVAASRVKASNLLRCFPLSSMFKPQKLYTLKPSVFTVKWFMDIGVGGMWKSRTG